MLENHITEINFSWLHFSWSFYIGALSAISLPLGTVCGLLFKPKDKTTGIFAAFGAGALLAALTIELVAPVVNRVIHSGLNRGSAVYEFWVLIFASICGGLVFIILDHLVNSYGGFFRKTATMINYFTKKKSTEITDLLSDISDVEVLEAVDKDLVQVLINKIRDYKFKKGELIFSEGDKGESLFFIREGVVNITSSDKNIAQLSKGDIMGEIALLTGENRTATAVAQTDLYLWELDKKDFDYLKSLSPEFAKTTTQIALKRLKEQKEKNIEKDDIKKHKKNKWIKMMRQRLHKHIQLPSSQDLKEEKKQHQNATFAIWLGILLDSIPESFVIGASFLALLSTKGLDSSFYELLPYTLIAGLFLSNFPEALSSSVGMKKQGMKTLNILLLWGSLVLITGLGSSLGYLISDSLAHHQLVAIEGLAAGAMLTMIISAMIPEAVHLGGEKSVGFSTLIGFLSALSFKLLE